MLLIWKQIEAKVYYLVWKYWRFKWKVCVSSKQQQQQQQQQQRWRQLQIYFHYLKDSLYPNQVWSYPIFTHFQLKSINKINKIENII
jgi:hypothetical protein